jgi:hypothetical protein
MYRDHKQPSLSRAIRRSRAAQAAQQRRRRRLVALMALFAVCLTGGGVWTIGALTGNDMVEAAVTKAQSLADLIAQRSPGTRTAGQLTKTKHARALAKQRVVPNQHAAAAMPAAKVPMPEIASLLAAPPIAPAAVDFEKPLPLAELTAPPPTLGGIIVPGPGGPPGEPPPASFPGPEPKTPVNPPSAVPEPGTWATMLLGFGLIGWQVRRSKRAQRKPTVA